jgi:hypothetical protein
VLTVIIALFAGGFLWLRRLATFETPARFLGAGASHLEGSPSAREGAGVPAGRAGASS